MLQQKPKRTVNMARKRKTITVRRILLKGELGVTLKILDDPKFDFYIIDALYSKGNDCVGSLRQIIHKEPPPGPFPQRGPLSEY